MTDKAVRAMEIVRLVLVAHAPLASALKAVALHVHEDCANDLVAVDVPPDWTGEHITAALQAALEADAERPTLFLVDAFGASPSNAVTRWMRSALGPTSAVHGVNVPMLWRALAYRHEPLPSLVDRALKGGSLGIGVSPPAV